MPRLSVWMIRMSLVYMGIGFLFGALILFHKGVPLDGRVWTLLNPHIELMIFGWTMQLAMGMAFWILPRFSGEGRYGRVYLGWWSFALLNSGVIVTAIAVWFGLPGFAVVGWALALLGVLAFTVMIWPRVKPLATGIHS